VNAVSRPVAAAIVLGTAALMAVSVFVTKRQATDAYRVQSARASERARAALQQPIDDHIDALSDLSKGMEAAPPSNRDDFRELAVRAAARGPAFLAINFLDHRFVETYLYPYGVNRALEGLDLKTRSDALPAAHRSVASRRPAATDLVPLAQGGEGFLAYVPVRHRDRWEGVVEGTLDKAAFAERYVRPAAPQGHDISLFSESSERPFFSTAEARGGSFRGAYSFYFTTGFADRRWWVVLNPWTSPSPLWSLVGVMLLELGLGVLLFLRFARRRPTI
jgi:sensor domain CHASE-containing protein